MGPDAIRKSTLARAFADVLGDLSELMRRELRLARAELIEKLMGVVHAVAWMSAAGVLWLLTALLVIEAIVFALASYGLPLHWSCLVVAAALAVLGVVAFAIGRSAVHGEVLPTRSIRQINESIKTAKEQLT
jgi:hypothetical protein